MPNKTKASANRGRQDKAAGMAWRSRFLIYGLLIGWLLCIVAAYRLYYEDVIPEGYLQSIVATVILAPSVLLLVWAIRRERRRERAKRSS